MGFKKRPQRKAHYWMLSVSYCLERHEWGSLDDKLEKIVGTPCDGAGTGFGYRDMDWSFWTEERAKEARRKLEESGLEIEIHDLARYRLEPNE